MNDDSASIGVLWAACPLGNPIKLIHSSIQDSFPSIEVVAMKFRPLLLSGLILFSIEIPAAPSPDLEREQRLKNEIVDAILDGDPIELKAEGHAFLAIDLPPGEDPKGGVILLHGRAFHPDWADVIQPLRIGLAEQGWRTLSIQLPVLEKDAKYFDYLPLLPHAEPRIQAAIDYLKRQGMDHIVLVAHSCGGHMANHRFHQKGDANIQAFVGIGMGATDYGQPMQQPFAIDKLNVPVLDLYAENDFPAVLRLAPERKAGFKHPKSRQIMIPGAEHYFVDKGDSLVETVGGWIHGLRDKPRMDTNALPR